MIGKFVTVAWLLAAMMAPGASAQVLYGTLVGNVAGPDHAVIPGAKVSIFNPATALKLEQTTDERGNYSFADLRPGTYTVSVTASGFSRLERSGVEVAGNTVSRADVVVAVAAVNQEVTVEAAGQLLQADSGDLHSELSSHEIETLPIGGYRNYQALLNLVPGATPTRFQNSVMDTPSRSLTTNVNGTSRNSIQTAVDGAAIQQVYLPHHTLYNPPSEAIETVNVTTNNFGAEQGLAGGAVVTVFTKSGTNRFHGSLWEDHTNSAIAARNFFYVGDSVPAHLLNQFGATMGGPIRRNRLFFFSAYEGTIQRQNYSTTVSVATAAERAGNFTGMATLYDPLTGNANGTGRTPFANNLVPAERMAPAAQKMLALVPLPNLAGTSNNYFASDNYSLDRHSFDEKVSWQIDERSSVFAKLSYMHAKVKAASSLGNGGGTGLSPGGSDAGSGDSTDNVYVGGIGYNRSLTPGLLVDANFGFGRNDLNWVENDYGTNYGTEVLGIPGTNGTDKRESGLPSFAVSGLETMGNTDAYTPEIKHDDIYTYAANLTRTHGAHTLRTGVQAVNNRMNEFQPQRGFGPRGGFTFNGGSTILNGGKSAVTANTLADFLLGNAATLGKSYQYLDPITATEWQEALYVQDRWQVTPRLTLTLGLRWEYYPILNEGGKGLNRYDMDTNQVLMGGTGDIPSGSGTTVNPHQFAPRAGIAYRVNQKTVLRGGYGITIDPYPFSRAMRDPYPVTIAQTISSTSTYISAGKLQTGIPAVAAITPVNGRVALPIDAYDKTLYPGEFTRGYIESFNVTVERTLPAALDLSAAYVGTRSIHQLAYLEANAGQIPGAGAAGQPLYAKFGRTAETQVITPFGTGNYNALQLNLKRRLLNGLTLRAVYTYSKSIDFNTDSDTTPLFNATAYWGRNRAVSDFDRTQVWQSSFAWELPFGGGHRWLKSGGVASALAGGWQLSGIVSRYTGLPFTATASSTSLNAANNTQVADLVKPHVATLGGVGSNATWFDTTAFAAVSQPRFGNAGRNILRGPSTGNFDLGVSRDFRWKDRFRFSLRADAFNVTNTPQFAKPATSASSSNFGHISATVGGAADSRVLRVSGKIAF